VSLCLFPERSTEKMNAFYVIICRFFFLLIIIEVKKKLFFTYKEGAVGHHNVHQISRTAGLK
jgi:hypothetical protein